MIKKASVKDCLPEMSSGRVKSKLETTFFNRKVFDSRQLNASKTTLKTDAQLYGMCCLCDVSMQKQIFIRHKWQSGKQKQFWSRRAYQVGATSMAVWPE